jgi:hypothetical protein
MKDFAHLLNRLPTSFARGIFWLFHRTDLLSFARGGRSLLHRAPISYLRPRSALPLSTFRIPLFEHTRHQSTRHPLRFGAALTRYPLQLRSSLRHRFTSNNYSGVYAINSGLIS